MGFGDDLNILITGASGFIGTKLIDTLVLNKKNKLRALVRDPIKYKSKQTHNIKCFKWNPESKEIDPNCIKDVDIVIHLAGENIASGRWTKKKKRKLVESRINGANLLISLIKNSGHTPAKFISASAIGIYGNRGDEILDENASLSEGFLPDLCKQWEYNTLNNNIQNMQASVVRTGIVLGEGGGALKKMTTPFNLGLGGVLGSGKQYMSWIHIDDLIRIYIFLIQTEQAKGIYNASSPVPVTNKVFTKTLASVLKRPSLFFVPAIVLKAIFGEMSQILLDSQRVMPQRLLDEDFSFNFPELEEALKSICKG